MTLPTEMRILVSSYCDRKSLVNLAVTERDWLGPCEFTLYETIDIELRPHSTLTDVPHALRLLRAITASERRASLVKRLFVVFPLMQQVTDKPTCAYCILNPESDDIVIRLERKEWKCGIHWRTIHHLSTPSDELMEEVASRSYVPCTSYYQRNCVIIWANLWRVFKRAHNLVEVELPCVAGNTAVARRTIHALSHAGRQLDIAHLPADMTVESHQLRMDPQRIVDRLAGPRKLAIFAGYAPGLHVAYPTPNMVQIATGGAAFVSLRTGCLMVFPALYRPGVYLERYLDSLRVFAQRPTMRHWPTPQRPEKVSDPIQLLLCVRVDQGRILADAIRAAVHDCPYTRRITEIEVSLLSSAAVFEKERWQRVNWLDKENPVNQTPPGQREVAAALEPLPNLYKFVIKYGVHVDPGPKWAEFFDGSSWPKAANQHNLHLEHAVFMKAGYT